MPGRPPLPLRLARVGGAGARVPGTNRVRSGDVYRAERGLYPLMHISTHAAINGVHPERVCAGNDGH